jgi:signal transduction histidine kinase
MHQPRILVVDDDPAMIELVREILEAIDCDVLAALDGQSALRTLRERVPEAPPDTILLDVKLPDIDGFQILREIKKDVRMRQIPVILLTGVDAVRDKAKGLQMGAEDYITKPFDPQELLARINVVLRIRRTEKMLRRRNQELAALNEINRMVSASLELDRVLFAALEGLERLVDADAFLVVLNDEESDDWVIRTARSPEGTWLEGRVVPLGRAAATRQALQTDRPTLQTAKDDFWTDTLGINPLDQLFVPLTTSDTTVGLLTVLSRANTLQEDYLPLLKHMSGTVSIAVENARLYGELTAFAEALERSQSQLIQAEKMAAVGRLTASIAHEINNPLQAVQNSLHLARHPQVETERRLDYLNMAQDEVQHLVHIVRRMLDFYRPASGSLKALQLNKPVQDALSIADKRMKQAHIDTVTRLANDLPPVLGSTNQLTQVFLNVIINAIEAMHDGGEFWVGTAYHEEKDQIVAAFRDSGPGIAPEIREHLFEPFHTTKETGTGLGLAISYGIVERHGGEIEVESPREGGATFIVRLPRYPNDHSKE